MGRPAQPPPAGALGEALDERGSGVVCGVVDTDTAASEVGGTPAPPCPRSVTTATPASTPRMTNRTTPPAITPMTRPVRRTGGAAGGAGHVGEFMARAYGLGARQMGPAGGELAWRARLGRSGVARTR